MTTPSILDSEEAHRERKDHPYREVACVVFENEQGQFLFIRNHRFPNSWGWIGGGRESEDGSLVETAIREAREEAGVLLSKQALIPIMQAPYDFGEGIVQFFRTSLAKNVLLNFNEEILESRWMTLEEAVKLPMFPASLSCLWEMISEQ